MGGDVHKAVCVLSSTDSFTMLMWLHPDLATSEKFKRGLFPLSISHALDGLRHQRVKGVLHFSTGVAAPKILEVINNATNRFIIYDTLEKEFRCFSLPRIFP